MTLVTEKLDTAIIGHQRMVENHRCMSNNAIMRLSWRHSIIIRVALPGYWLSVGTQQ